MTYLWQHTFAKIGEDWVFLALLGVMMAVISFVMDEGIDKCNAARRILYNEISGKYVASCSSTALTSGLSFRILRQ